MTRAASGRRGKPRRARPAKTPSQPDVLLDILTLARAEGALEGDALVTFVDALRQRARLILAERVARQDERIRSLEAENSWRRTAIETLEESIRALEKEVAWRRDAMASLDAATRALQEEKETSDRALGKERAWRQDAMARLEEAVRTARSEAEELRGEHRKATQAHDSLLAHHEATTRRVAAELVAIAEMPLPRAREALTALAGILRSEP